MLTSHLRLITLSFLISILASNTGFAQDNATDLDLKDAVTVPKTTTRTVKRVVEPIPYWVEADQLRIRNNPYAGDVIGMLEIGQKVKVSKTVDDWVLISSGDDQEQWVNRNFLSPSPVTWAAYKFDSRQSRKLGQGRFGDVKYDIKKKRIKIKDLKGVRVYAADIKRLADRQKIVISRHDYRAGAYYEKRMVTCADDGASHVKMLGEGYTVMMMEADPRRERVGIPMSEQDQIENEAVSQVAKAIAEFTCETEKL